MKQTTSSTLPQNSITSMPKNVNNTISKTVYPPQYFAENKKGEVNELKQLLKKTLNEKDKNKRRDVLKKVISFMTLGIDVSRLFSEVCMVSYTDDMIQKKMVYLYIVTYAESHPNLAIMAINTLQKDCKHTDPKIRGLALRNLCSLHFAGSFDYLYPSIVEALKDRDPYVKKTAIMGCVKLYYMQPDIIKSGNIVNLLYALIKDPDPIVITNSIWALNEILQEEDGIAINTKMIIYLLNKLKDFNEWGQATILELTAKYKPKSEKELLDIMNILEDKFKHSCLAVVLACIKIFINFTKDYPKIHKQVYERIQCISSIASLNKDFKFIAPLITMISSSEVGGSYELAFVTLTHIHYIVSRGGSEFFAKNLKQFYCKLDDPTYIKDLKINIIKCLANDNNLNDILMELSEYVTDVDTDLARKSIKALGGIAQKSQNMASSIIKQLTAFISMNQEYIANETLIAFKDILRKYKTEYEDVIQIIQQSIEYITEPDSKVALIWILGEYGQYIDDAPYILEGFIKNFESGDENNRVKYALLKSSVQLFLKRAPEMLSSLKTLFELILSNENEDYDLKDRALFYARTLQNSAKELKDLMEDRQNFSEMFFEDQELIKIGVNIEFNTLSVIYEKPVEKFIKSYSIMHAMRCKEQDELLLQDNQTKKIQNGDAKNLGLFQKQSLDDFSSGSSPSKQDYQEDNSTVVSNNQNSIESPVEKLELDSDDLVEDFELDEETFQEKWEELPERTSLTRFLKNIYNINEESFEKYFKYEHIYCIASGKLNDEIKFYFFCKLAKTENLILMELLINTTFKTWQIKIKTVEEDIVPLFARYVEERCRTWGAI